jgi:hypothetical protein
MISSAKGKALFDKHIGKIDFTLTPDKAVKQWAELGKKARNTSFGRNLHTLLEQNVASGTHSQAWKDEFMKRKKKTMKNDSRRSVRERKMKETMARTRVRKRVRSSNDDTASTSTTPMDEWDSAFSSHKVKAARRGSTSSPRTMVVGSSSHVASSSSGPLTRVSDDSQSARNDASPNKFLGRLPSPPRIVPRRARSKTFVVKA